jgi:hypothetical protein
MLGASPVLCYHGCITAFKSPNDAEGWIQSAFSSWKRKEKEDMEMEEEEQEELKEFK